MQLFETRALNSLRLKVSNNPHGRNTAILHNLVLLKTKPGFSEGRVPQMFKIRVSKSRKFQGVHVMERTILALYILAVA